MAHLAQVAEDVTIDFTGATRGQRLAEVKALIEDFQTSGLDKAEIVCETEAEATALYGSGSSYVRNQNKANPGSLPVKFATKGKKLYIGTVEASTEPETAEVG